MFSDTGQRQRICQTPLGYGTFGGGILHPEPHQPPQCGTNEDTNGLLRQYSPKYQDIGWWSDEEIWRVADKINLSPLKCLGWEIAFECYFQKSLQSVWQFKCQTASRQCSTLATYNLFTWQLIESDNHIYQIIYHINDRGRLKAWLDAFRRPLFSSAEKYFYFSINIFFNKWYNITVLNRL